MSVTVVLRLQARPSQVDALLAAGTALYRSALQAGLLRAVRALRGLNDPDCVLVLGEWQTREAYWASREQQQAGAGMVALCVKPPQRHFFEPLGYYEDLSRQAEVMAAAFIHLPAPPPEFADYLLHEGRRLTADAPGLVYRYAYGDADNPCHFLVCHGWASGADWERFRLERLPLVTAAASAHGATLEPFAGQTHADQYGLPDR
jgi:quinol monooxygenase YgiN